MAADSVEREILIEASPEVVWGVITEPEQISRWFSDEAQVEGRAGAGGTLTWRPGGRGGDKAVDTIVPIWVVEAEPFRRGERLEYDQQRQTDRVREQRLVLGVRAVRGVNDRVWDMHVERLLAARVS